MYALIWSLHTHVFSSINKLSSLICFSLAKPLFAGSAVRDWLRSILLEILKEHSFNFCYCLVEDNHPVKQKKNTDVRKIQDVSLLLKRKKYCFYMQTFWKYHGGTSGLSRWLIFPFSCAYFLTGWKCIILAKYLKLQGNYKVLWWCFTGCNSLWNKYKAKIFFKICIYNYFRGI